AVERLVPRLVDDAHAAAAEHGFDRESRELRRELLGRRRAVGDGRRATRRESRLEQALRARAPRRVGRQRRAARRTDLRVAHRSPGVQRARRPLDSGIAGGGYTRGASEDRAMILREFPPMGVYETLFRFAAATGTYMGEPGTHPWAQGFPLTTQIPGG